MYERKRLLPLRDAIILHLEPLSSRGNPYVMPDSTCQEAMSSRLSASRGNLSRVMNELKDDGYLEETRAHVPIGTLRRKTYILTEVGMREARELRRRTGEKTVRLKDESGNIASIELREIPEEIKDGSSLLDIALKVQKGIFDKRAHMDAVRKASSFVCIEEQRPRFWQFFGREKELKKMSDWFDSGTESILEVRGAPGIGKTAFVAAAFERLRDTTNTLWLSLNEQSSVDSVLEEMAAFLRLLGKNKLDTYLKYHSKRREKDALVAVGNELERGDLKADEERRTNEILYIIKGELKTESVLIVFDGCEKSHNRMAEFIGLLTERMVDHKDLRIILAGRSLSKIRNLTKLRKSGQSRQIIVPKLDYESSEKILRLKGVEGWRMKDVYKETGGLPFLLDLMGPSYEPEETDINGYLEEEVFQQLSVEEERILRFLSVFNEPVHSDAFFQWKRMKFEAVRSLVEKSLLTEVSPMVYDTHDILKDYIGSDLKGKTRKEYHKRAAAYYNLRKGTEEILRSASHLVAGGEVVEAGNLLAEKGRGIVAKGLARDLLPILQIIEMKKKHPAEAELSFLRGECLSYEGMWDEAINEYDRSLLLSEAEEDFERMSTSLRRIAEIQIWRGMFDEALEPLQRSAEMAEKIEDFVGLTESYYSIGGLMWKTGNLEEYRSSVDRCLEAAKASENTTAIARAYKGLGVFKDNMGKTEESLAIKQEAVEYANKTDDLVLQSNCYGNLAKAFYDLKRKKEALKLDLKSLEIARQTGDARSIAHHLSNTASVYISMGKDVEAKEYVVEAEEILRNTQENRMLAQVFLQYGYVYSDEDWSKATEFMTMGLDIIDDIGSPATRCDYYTNVGHLYLWNRDKKGVELLDKASTLASGIGEVSLRHRLEEGIKNALKDRKRIE
jgi:tetratricopeptide (TPR) repeat protein/DNA-binding PadR family transcriptional regulator